VPSYLVETYLARGQVGARSTHERRVRRAADEATRKETTVRLQYSIYLPEDEICLFVFDAPSGQEAAAVAQRAGLDLIRVVEAVTSGENAR
jgi:hypothetical protein